VKRANNHSGNSQNYNRYSYALNTPLKYTDPSGYTYKPDDWDGHPHYSNSFGPGIKGCTKDWRDADAYFYATNMSYDYNTNTYTDLYGNTVSQETAVGASLAGFGGSFENKYSSSTAGFNLYLVSAFGNTTIVSSFGDIGNVEYAANGGLTFDNQTAGAYAGEVSVGSAGGGDDYSLLGNLFMHYQLGGESRFNISTSDVDLSYVRQKNLLYNKKSNTYSVNLFALNKTSPTALGFGKISLSHIQGNTYIVESDFFDFDYQATGSFSRNAATFIGGAVFGQFFDTPVTTWGIIRNYTGIGGPFWVDFNGTVYIKP